ncbi:MAG: hypothetical protein U9N11_06870 [Campylobacterota bacterium]|nr:hypothetical protein [Campylobacterota bacterium]
MSMIKTLFQASLLGHLYCVNNGSLRNELGSKVRTPFDALEAWFKIEPKLFKISSDAFRAYAIEKLEQRGET